MKVVDKELKKVNDNAKKVHGTWYRFTSYAMKIVNTTEWYDCTEKLVGYDVSIKLERYCKKYLPEVKIVFCDDDVYASSVIFLIPHPTHGIRLVYIPQCTEIKNVFFLYESYFKQLNEALKELKYVYTK